MQQINFILGKLLLSRFAQLLSFELLYQSFSSTRSHYNAQIKDSVDASGILYVPCCITELQVAESVLIRAADDLSVSQSFFTITEKAPTRAFSWLKVSTSAFTFKTLSRHYAKRALTPR